MKSPTSNLVYWVHSKCACSFYKKIFEKLNWSYITTDEVNWENAIVFSYIRDPLVKHRIGIIEWFYYNNCIDLLEQLSNPQFAIMLSSIAYMDWHSMSIFEHLGAEKSLKIQWIPIDHMNTNHVWETIKLIEQHDIMSESDKHSMLTAPKVYASVGNKKHYNQTLLDIPPTSMIIKSLEFDTFLYDRVTKTNFEPSNFSQQIAFLRQQGLSQEQAEAQADNDVLTGNYLNWKFNA